MCSNDHSLKAPRRLDEAELPRDLNEIIEEFIMSTGLIIVAAGNGTRMGTSIRKPYLQIGETPILILTIRQFYSIPQIKEIVLVVHQDEIANTEQLLFAHQLSNIHVVAGGAERQSSVQIGVHCLSKEVEYVLIHDGARPFVSRALIEQLIQETQQKKAVIPAVPVKDTIKVVKDSGIISATPDRKGLWAAQTPQAFSLTLFKEAMQYAEKKAFNGTDDASLVEYMNAAVHIIPGEETNIKITTPDDLLFAERIHRMKGEEVQ